MALARVLIARRRADEASRLLDRLVGLAEAGGRTGNVIELLALQAMAHQAGENRTHGLAALGRALALAEPEGYVRVFVDEGEAMKLLIANYESQIEKCSPTALRHDIVRLRHYARRLLTTFDEPVSVTASQSTIGAPRSAVIEPLSDRELEVLRLLAAGKSNQEIADALILAVGTVKKHLNNIFGKLEVESRTQCVARARELSLV